MRKALSITLVLMVAFCVPAFARSVDNTNAQQKLYEMDVLEPGLQSQGGVFGAASAGTTYFGGTAWDAVDGRYEAISGGTWTFDSGSASSYSSTVEGGRPISNGLTFNPAFTTLNPFKSPLLHTMSEGWVGWDNSYGVQTQFRRLSSATTACVGAPTIPGGGSFSFHAGLLEAEARNACWADTLGTGYGDAWNLCIELTSLSITSGGNVTWSFAYASDTEPGFDYAYAYVDTNGATAGGRVTVQTNTGPASGNASIPLVPGTSMRSNNGSVAFEFCVAADGAYSDQDGLYPTGCGAMTVDNVSIVGGGILYGSPTAEGFETGTGNWALKPAAAGQGGEWSDIVALTDLPATKTPCTCRLADSVLVFEDINLAGHGLYTDNLAASPVIDIDAAGLTGTPGKNIEFDGYFELQLLNYIFVQTNVKWYPFVCAQTGGTIDAPWTSDGFVRYFGGVPTCTTPDVAPITVPFGARIDAGAEEVQIALGALSYCRFFANCTGQTNSTPWFDNVRFYVFGTQGAPLIATRTVDFALDAFPQASTLNPSAPGRLDPNNVKGQPSPEPGAALGDTMTVTGGLTNPISGCGVPAVCGTEVQVVFNVCPGPGASPALTAWLTSHPDVTAEVGTRSALGTWRSARMDTAEQGGTQTSTRSWMTAYHESDSHFAGTDGTRSGDLDPFGNPRLSNDIFKDDLFTPGTRVNYFYRARYLDNLAVWFELPAASSSFEFSAQEGTAGHFEFEVLPSSTVINAGVDTTWNCLLYVDHFDGRGAQQPIETGLAAVLPGGSGNCENVRWDRWDVEAPSSQQWSLGRAANTQAGATVTHLLAYQGIMWNSGNLSAFNFTKEDADQMDAWLTIGDVVGISTYNKFYDNGDGSAESITQEQASEPSALVFLNQLCGVALRCRTYRDNTCNASAAEDLTACVDVDPLGAGTPATGRGANLVVGQGNGCPQLRSFDILDKVLSTRYGAVPAEDEGYNTAANPAAADYASIALDQPNSGAGATYSTVVDGISVHYRRDKVDCTGVGPIQGRLSEVLTWLGLTGATNCENPANLVDVPVRPGTAFKTALANFAPNPLFSGATGTIQFTMAKDGKAAVDIFDVNGRLVKTVFDGSAKEGLNVIHWNGKDATERQVASGVYFTRLRAFNEEYAKKMVVVAGNGN
jgi:hypothetical protein